MTTSIANFLSPLEVKTLTDLGVSETHLWERGRQETGYEKLDLRSLVLKDAMYQNLADRALALISATRESHWDIWLLRYPDDSYIPPHRDEATAFGLRHRRLNALVIAPQAGGELQMAGEILPFAVGDGVLFYPDQVEHSISQVVGIRLVFSVGAWV